MLYDGSAGTSGSSVSISAAANTFGGMYCGLRVRARNATRRVCRARISGWPNKATVRSPGTTAVSGALNLASAFDVSAAFFTVPCRVSADGTALDADVDSSSIERRA